MLLWFWTQPLFCYCCSPLWFWTPTPPPPPLNRNRNLESDTGTNLTGKVPESFLLLNAAGCVEGEGEDVLVHVGKHSLGWPATLQPASPAGILAKIPLLLYRIESWKEEFTDKWWSKWCNILLQFSKLPISPILFCVYYTVIKAFSDNRNISSYSQYKF